MFFVIGKYFLKNPQHHEMLERISSKFSMPKRALSKHRLLLPYRKKLLNFFKVFEIDLILNFITAFVRTIIFGYRSLQPLVVLGKKPRVSLISELVKIIFLVT